MMRSVMSFARTPRVADVGGLLGVLVVAVLDWWTGLELAFSAFYLLPIGYTARFGHRGAGVAAAALGAGAFLAAELLAGRVYSASSVAVWNTIVRFGTFVVVVLLVHRLVGELARVTALSQTDALTGLARGSHLLDVLADEIERARRYRHAFSAAYLDVDDFKTVNDTLGHAGGDDVLRGVGRALRRSTRSTDTCARMGGDEFMVLMPETDADAARQVADRMQSALREGAARGHMRVTFSIGVVTFESPPTSRDAAVSAVDDLMYEVKRSGKDGYRQTVVRQEREAPPSAHVPPPDVAR